MTAYAIETPATEWFCGASQTRFARVGLVGRNLSQHAEKRLKSINFSDIWNIVMYQWLSFLYRTVVVRLLTGIRDIFVNLGGIEPMLSTLSNRHRDVSFMRLSAMTALREF